MVTTDTHKNCNRQAGLIFLGVRRPLDLVASDEKFRRRAWATGGTVGMYTCALTQMLSGRGRS